MMHIYKTDGRKDIAAYNVYRVLYLAADDAESRSVFTTNNNPGAAVLQDLAGRWLHTLLAPRPVMPARRRPYRLIRNEQGIIFGVANNSGEVLASTDPGSPKRAELELGLRLAFEQQRKTFYASQWRRVPGWPT